MKKIFTLAFALGIMTISFAQSGHYDGRNDSRNVVITTSQNVYNDHGRGDYDRQKNEMIQKVNRDFDFKIMQVNRNFYLRNGEKRRQVSMLERQRAEQIRQINARFAGMRDNRFDDNKHNGWK